MASLRAGDLDFVNENHPSNTRLERLERQMELLTDRVTGVDSHMAYLADKKDLKSVKSLLSGLEERIKDLEKRLTDSEADTSSKLGAFETSLQNDAGDLGSRLSRMDNKLKRLEGVVEREQESSLETLNTVLEGLAKLEMSR